MNCSDGYEEQQQLRCSKLTNVDPEWITGCVIIIIIIIIFLNGPRNILFSK